MALLDVLIAPRPNSPLWHAVSRLPWRLAVPFYAASARRRIAPLIGRPADLARPQTLSERTAARMFTLHHPLLRRLVDKYELRGLVAERIGPAHALPLLGVWRRPQEIPWEDLPFPCVVKCTHGSRLNLFLTERAGFDQRAAEHRLARWQLRRHHRRYGEACYCGIPPRIVAEPWLGPPGQLPDDYKVHVFCGRARFLQHYRGRCFSGKAAITNWYDRDLRWLPIATRGDTTVRPDPAAAALFDLAERLVPDLVYARVDFFLVAEQPLVAEVTLAPGAGTNTSLTPEGNALAGEVWAEEEARAKAEGRYAALI